MNEAVITLKKGEGRTVKAGGMWIFDNEIESISGRFINGDIVVVHDFDGYPMGKGFINENSKIRIRMMTRNAAQEINHEFLKQRVEDAWKYRKMTVDTRSCRIIFGEADFLPGLVVDKFSDVLVVESLALGIDRWKDDIVLLSVGELNANKNHELAIKALAKLRDKHFAEFAQVQYLICGQGNLKEYLEKVIFESRLENQIHLLGYREDINEILGCSDIFLFLSKREGLPIALIEAMASGLACVVTHIRGNVDLIRDHKEGLIVDTDVQNVSHALLTLIHADRKKYQKNAIKRSKEYSNHVVNRSMEKIYLSLLKI